LERTHLDPQAEYFSCLQLACRYLRLLFGLAEKIGNMLLAKKITSYKMYGKKH